jgi:hypothetical protein
VRAAGILLGGSGPERRIEPLVRGCEQVRGIRCRQGTKRVRCLLRSSKRRRASSAHLRMGARGALPWCAVTFRLMGGCGTASCSRVSPGALAGPDAPALRGGLRGRIVRQGQLACGIFFQQAVEKASGECESRQKSASKRSVHAVHEHFEPVFNAGSSRMRDFQQPASAVIRAVVKP